MECEWDEDKANANLKKHKVSFDDAATVFGDFLSRTFPDPDHSSDEDRFVTIGTSDRGRVLIVSLIRIATTAIGSSALARQRRVKGRSMKKKPEKSKDDDLRAEYDASLIRSGVRGKYAKRYHEGKNLVLLAPDVAAAFPDAKAVNDALRLLMSVAKKTANGKGAMQPKRIWCEHV
jgi:uncharacterized DUF497 family protein